MVVGRVANQRLARRADGAERRVAEPGDGEITFTVTSQGPNGMRDPIAPLLGLDQEQVRVIAPAVGGGFGAKSGVYPEYVVLGVAARSSAGR